MDPFNSNLRKLQESWSLMESGSTLTLYHGGRLDDSYEATKSHKKGRWEYGPGLYLTTHYGTAAKYAKGGRRLYRITIEKGTDIEDVDIDRSNLHGFIDSFIKTKNRKQLKSDLERWTTGDKIKALPFLNLVINDDAIKSTYTGHMRNFLVDNGIDYHIVSNAFGWGETMIVLYNMDKILKKEIMGPNDSVEDLPTKFSGDEQ